MKLGSRGSPLALAQSRMVAAMLGLGEDAIQSFTTSGDVIQGRLQDAGGKGLFTKELDEALLDGRVNGAPLVGKEDIFSGGDIVAEFF